ncbi:unnamed protein product [Alopecurus aequalis]
MSSSNNRGINGAGTTILPPRPHWRSRDPTATVVFVVHASQFRDVVQQLTGATHTKTVSQAHRYAAGACITTDANAVALAQRRRDPEDDNARATTTTTLRQMMEECIAWATDGELTYTTRTM